MDRKGGTDFCIKDFTSNHEKLISMVQSSLPWMFLKESVVNFLKKTSLQENTMVAFVFCVTKGVILGIFRNIQNSYSVEHLVNL